MKNCSSLCLLLLLLLLSLILSQVQGIRLGEGFSSASHQKNQVEESSSLINGGEVTVCRSDGQCSSSSSSSSGINRKLMTKTTSTSTTSTTSTTTTTTTTTNSKNMKKHGRGKFGDEVSGKEEENFHVNASPASNHPQAAPEGYPDIIDIAGMDYSPARRKPPIHN